MSSVTQTSSSTTTFSYKEEKHKPPVGDISSSHTVQTTKKLFAAGTEQLNSTLSAFNSKIPSAYHQLQQIFDRIHRPLPAFSQGEIEVLELIISAHSRLLCNIDNHISLLDVISVSIYFIIKTSKQNCKELELFVTRFFSLHVKIIEEVINKKPNQLHDHLNKIKLQNSPLELEDIKNLNDSIESLRRVCANLDQKDRYIDQILNLFGKLINAEKNARIFLTFAPFGSGINFTQVIQIASSVSSVFSITDITKQHVSPPEDFPYTSHLAFLEFYALGMSKNTYRVYFSLIFERFTQPLIRFKEKKSSLEDLQLYFEDKFFKDIGPLITTPSSSQHTTAEIRITVSFLLKIMKLLNIKTPVSPEKRSNEGIFKLRLISGCNNYIIYYEKIEKSKGIKAKFLALFQDILGGAQKAQLFYSRLKQIIETLNPKSKLDKHKIFASLKIDYNIDQIISLIKNLHEEFSKRVSEIFNKNPEDREVINTVKQTKISFLENSRHIVTLVLLLHDIKKMTALDFSDETPESIIPDDLLLYLDPDVISTQPTDSVELEYNQNSEGSSMSSISSSSSSSSSSFEELSITPFTSPVTERNLSSWVATPSTSSSSFSSPFSSQRELFSQPANVSTSSSSTTTLSPSPSQKKQFLQLSAPNTNSAISSSASSSSTTTPSSSSKKTKTPKNASSSSTPSTATPSSSMIPRQKRSEKIEGFQLRKNTMKIRNMRIFLAKSGITMTAESNGSGHRDGVDSEENRVTSIPAHGNATLRIGTRMSILKAAQGKGRNRKFKATKTT